MSDKLTPTPGPWRHAPSMEGPIFRVVLNEQGNIAAMRVTSEANARLISAAPDFLNAAIIALWFFDRIKDGAAWHQHSEDSAREALRAAIEKATGEAA